MNEVMNNPGAWLAVYGVNIGGAIVIFFVGRWLAGLITNLLEKGLSKKGVEATLTGFLKNITYATLLTIVVVATINQLGVQTTSFIAIIGAAGLAVGLALQGSLSNFAAGVMIIIFRPFKQGDYVEAAGTAGIVEEIKVFSTQLRSPDNKTIIVPNSAIMAGNIVNYSTKPTRRVDMVFGVAYDADLKKARDTLAAILAEDSRILKDPAPTIAVGDLADSNVNFFVRPWVNSADYWNVYFDVTEQVKLRFDAAGVGIPFPQMDVHLDRAANGG
jgi:small conductance mechanosensitive channel